MKVFVIFVNDFSVLRCLSSSFYLYFLVVISERTQWENSLFPSLIELLLVGRNSCMYQKLSIPEDNIEERFPAGVQLFYLNQETVKRSKVDEWHWKLQSILF
jgi:hypothetical protein